MPDVFAFAILPTGDVIPMGIAEYDAKFLPTRISYRENKSIYFHRITPIGKLNMLLGIGILHQIQIQSSKRLCHIHIMTT